MSAYLMNSSLSGDSGALDWLLGGLLSSGICGMGNVTMGAIVSIFVCVSSGSVGITTDLGIGANCGSTGFSSVILVVVFLMPEYLMRGCAERRLRCSGTVIVSSVGILATGISPELEDADDDEVDDMVVELLLIGTAAAAATGDILIGGLVRSVLIASVEHFPGKDEMKRKQC